MERSYGYHPETWRDRVRNRRLKHSRRRLDKGRNIFVKGYLQLDEKTADDLVNLLERHSIRAWKQMSTIDMDRFAIGCMAADEDRACALLVSHGFPPSSSSDSD